MIPCIWCDDDARGAADLYVAAFPDSRITSVGFELNGRPLLAMNGGPKLGGPSDASRRLKPFRPFPRL